MSRYILTIHILSSLTYVYKFEATYRCPVFYFLIKINSKIHLAKSYTYLKQ